MCITPGMNTRPELAARTLSGAMESHFEAGGRFGPSMV